METVKLETAISYVAGAYIGIWLLLFVYLVVLNGRLRSLRMQVEALSEALSSKKSDEKSKTGI